MKFFAHGKLLLTAEYAVLGGAKALAVPTKMGQSLEVVETGNTIQWKSIDRHGDLWYENEFDITSFAPKRLNEIGKRLQHLFVGMKTQNPTCWNTSTGFSFTTTLDFDRSWGLGSSSTLISILAQWAKVNPYVLQQRVFGGSGYDIACADARSAIVYERTNALHPKVTPIPFSPEFKDQLFFVYLNQKQDSQKAVAAFDKSKLTSSRIKKINTLTAQFLQKVNLQNFQELMLEHEEIIGHIIGMTPLQKRLFTDYNGAVKSLGAWGGDFVLACGDATTPNYFANKGYATCLHYDSLISYAF
jgi:mevalonate kinase